MDLYIGFLASTHSLQKVFYKPGNASYEKTNTSDFKPVGFFSKFLSHLSFTLQNEDLKIL